MALTPLKTLVYLDARTKKFLDRVLPRSLTKRYLVGFGMVAIFLFLGQCVVQLTLERQTQEQNRIRNLESQLHLSENLLKELLATNLSSGKKETTVRTESIVSGTQQLGSDVKLFQEINDHYLMRLTRSTQTKEQIEKLDQLYNRIVNSGELLKKSLSLKSKNQLGKEDYEFTSVVAKLEESVRRYQSETKSTIAYFYEVYEKRLIQFKRTELIILFLILITLSIEALYVFRPTAEGLTDALQVRSDFLSRMSHEVRNPMNSIIGMSNLLAETNLDDQQKNYNLILGRSSRGLLDMLNNLLDFSSLESGKIKLEEVPFNIYELIDRSVDMITFATNRNRNEVLIDVDHNVPVTLIGDPTRLYQVLSNLLTNAAKFTSDGQIILRVELLSFGEKVSLKFSVQDSGIGIDKIGLSKIFEPFTQEDSSVRRRFGGTGLGLNIAMQLVDCMGGRLEVESEKGVGSCFSFKINLHVKNDLTLAMNFSSQVIAPFEVVIVEKSRVLSSLLQQWTTDLGGQSRVIQSLSDFPDNLRSEVDHQVICFIDYSQNMEIKKGLGLHTVFILDPTTVLPKQSESLESSFHYLYKPIKPLEFFRIMTSILRIPEIAPENQVISPSVGDVVSPTRSLNVLVADDSYDNQVLIAAYLSKFPYKIEFANDGKKAIQRFKEGSFDIILMDIQMPEVDGFTAARIIRDWEQEHRLKPIPIIAISAHDQSYKSGKFKEAKFTARLIKPIDQQDLKTILEEVSDKGSKEKTKGSEQRTKQVQEHIASMIPKYLDGKKNDIQVLRPRLQNGDFDSLKMFGHKLKGNGTSFGFPQLSEIGAELEHAALKNDAQESSKLLEKISVFIDQEIEKRRV